MPPYFYIILLLLFYTPAILSDIVIQPPHSIVPAGSNITINCTTPDNNAASISWLNSTNDVISSESNTSYITLHLYSVVSSLNGSTYYCNVTMDNSTILVQHTTIQVLYIDSMFRVDPISYTLTEGSYTLLTCTPPHGWYTPSVTWSKDGAPLSIMGTSLNLSAVTSLDGGVYKCRANNTQGEVFSGKSVITITTESVDLLYANATQTINLSCHTNIFNVGTITWQFGGDIIQNLYANQFTITDLQNADNTTSSILTIDSFHAQLANTYKCLIQTDTNTLQVIKAFSLKIPTLDADFIGNPISSLVFEAQTVSVACLSPSGDPAPTVLFYKDNIVISNNNNIIASNDSISISSFGSADAGNYSCVSYNAAGYRIAYFTLTYAPSPLVTIIYNDMIISDNNSNNLYIDTTHVTLQCITDSSYPMQEFVWYKNDNRLLETDRILINSSSGLLEFLTFNYDDSYDYYCQLRISTAFSQLTANSAKLNLYVKTETSSNVEASIGDTITLYCNHSKNSKVSWFYGNRLMSNSTDLWILGPQLNFTKLSLLHQGQYSCKFVANGKSYKRHYSIIIVYGPILIVPINEVTVRVSSTAHLMCIATGYPPPSVCWVKVTPYGGNATVDSLIQFIQQDGSLIIPNVKLTDGGEYLCVAGPNSGTHSTNNCSGSDNTSKVARVYLRVTYTDIPRSPQYLTVEYIIIAIAVIAVIAICISCLLCTSTILYNKIIRIKNKRSYNRHNILTDEETMNIQLDTNKFVSPKSNSIANAILMSPNRNKSYQPLNQPNALQNALPLGTMDLELTECDKFPIIEFPREHLHFGDRLGDGKFGPIIQGLIEGHGDNSKHVAVECYIKTNIGGFPTPDELHSLPAFHLHHTNISMVIGISTSVQPYYVIYEYSEIGNLKEFLINANEQNKSPGNTLKRQSALSEERHYYELDIHFVLTQNHLINICTQVSNGLEFLTCREIVFRDVATRSCCINSTLHVKLVSLPIGQNLFPGDYCKRESTCLPVRWIAPESLQNGKYSIESDIWSFGVFCWEVFSFGKQPFDTLTDEQILEQIPHGLRLLMPEAGCPDDLYQLMLNCWNMNPDKRPKFSHLYNTLINIDCD